jgi:hypothetical protein
MITNLFYQVTFMEVKEALIAIKYNFQGFDDDVLSEGQPIHNWPLNSEIMVKGQNPTESLFCPLKPWLLVSRKVRTTLEEYAFQGIQFLPIRVLHQSGIEIPGYSIINILEMVEGLDYENSTWLTSEKWNVEYPQLDILEIAIRKEAVINKDIFRIKEMKTQIFVSNHLKRCLKKNGAITGFKFLPVITY